MAFFDDVGNDWYSYAPTNMNSYDTDYYWSVRAVDPYADNMVTEKTFKFTTEPQIWSMPGWAYRKQITIDHTNVNGTLNNFPVMIEFTDANVGANAQADADDMLFTTSDGTTKLAHEIESYDPATGHLVAWVNVPVLSSTEDTILYMYYGNPTAENQENSTGVWDANYLAVHHLEETEGDVITDSTEKNDGIQSNVVLNVDGKINGADQFNGVDSRITLPQVYTNETQFTIDMWYYLDGDKQSYLISQRDSATQQGVLIQYTGLSGYIQMFVNNRVVERPTFHDWHQVVGTYDGTRMRLYVDGDLWTNSLVNLTWPEVDTLIGDRSLFDRTYQGILDEIRLSDVARSAAYIKTSYNNQNDPSSFIRVGEEEVALSKPAIINEAPVHMSKDVSFRTTELSFDLWDNFNELMDYTVTTSPNIGSKSGSNVGNGKIIMNVSGLMPATDYTWIVDVTDGVESAHKEFTFKTIRSYELTASVIGSGSIVADSEAPYASGIVVQLTAVPDEGWRFIGWTEDLSGMDEEQSLTMNKDHAVTAIFRQEGVPLLADADFEASTNSADLRLNSTVQDWYDSRVGWSGSNTTLLTLNTQNVGGNSGKKAKMNQSWLIDGKYVGNVYLSQEFVVPQPSIFSVEWDIYVDTILDYSDVDRAAHMMIGADLDGSRGPSSSDPERFVVMGFYHQDGSTVPGDSMSLLAQEHEDSMSNSSEWRVIANNLSMDKWYNIRLEVNVLEKNYDVYIDNVLVAENVLAFDQYYMDQLTHISFATWNDGIGTFYIDNVQEYTEPICIDMDNDGYGDNCALGLDCNDNNASINPGAMEICDGIDNDCDAGVNEDDVCSATPYYCDVDMDSYISVAIEGHCNTFGCVPPAGCSETAGNDCDDGNYFINPGASDADCNNVDENCDGTADEGFLPESTTCGLGVCANTGTSSCMNGIVSKGCEPLDPSSMVDESCDGIDQDCDGTADEEFTPYQSFCGIGVCQATGTMTCSVGVETSSCIPGVPSEELCDNLDNDCDNEVDEDLTQPTTCGFGICSANTGFKSCVLGSWGGDTCDPFSGATTETCDGTLDEDCDNAVDEGCNCTTGATILCGSDTGICQSGLQTCQDNGTWSAECGGQVLPEASDDNCDGLDNDCDGTSDEGYVPTASECGLGVCASTGTKSCIAGVETDSCTEGAPLSVDDATCDNIDDNCDGTADEGYVSSVTSCFSGENDVCQITDLSGITSCIDGNVTDSCDDMCSNCGDEVCNNGETCSTCATDCGVCAPATPPKKSSGSTGGSPVVWDCGEWSECSGGKQTQKCTYGYSSKTNTQSCTVALPVVNTPPVITAVEPENAPVEENAEGSAPVLTGLLEGEGTGANEITGLVAGDEGTAKSTPWGFIAAMIVIVALAAGAIVFVLVKRRH